MRTKLFVTYTKDGWRLRGAGGGEAGGQQFFLQPSEPAAADQLFPTKREAVTAAREAAEKLVAAGGRVSLYIGKIKGRRFLEERTYPRSSDPRKTPG